MEQQSLIALLSWLGGLTGVLLLLMFVGSLLGFHVHTDMDVDVDLDTDSDGDGSSLGIFKSFLTMISIGSLTLRAILLDTHWSWPVAITISLVAGVVAILLLTGLMKLLIRMAENGTWNITESLGQTGEVYIPIPENGMGVVNISVKGAFHELNAKEKNGVLLSTGTTVEVVEVIDNYVVVIKK